MYPSGRLASGGGDGATLASQRAASPTSKSVAPNTDFGGMILDKLQTTPKEVENHAEPCCMWLQASAYKHLFHTGETKQKTDLNQR